MSSSRALYDALEINVTCSDKDIKVAYRRLALIHHPDKPGGNAEKFQAIQQAYEVLSDPDARKRYDATGHYPGSGASRSFADDDSDLDEAEEFFRFAFNPRRPQPFSTQRKYKAQSTTVPLALSLEDLYKGKHLKLAIKKQQCCKTCKGSGAKPGAKALECVTCQGFGQIKGRRAVGPNMYQTVWSTCSRCQGTGRAIRTTDQCVKCQGQKTFQVSAKVTVNVAPGMADQEIIVLAEQGDEEPEADRPGDIIFAIKALPHPTFHVQHRHDLHATIHLTLSELLFGFDRVILVHIDGTPLRVAHSKPIAIESPGWLVIKGYGMPIPNRNTSEQAHGDLYIELKAEQSIVDWMSSLTLDQKSALEHLLPPKKPNLDMASQVTCKATHIEEMPSQQDEDDWQDEDEDASHIPTNCQPS